jgi:membrane-associated protease RseP (regulator of RpoE activity)
MQPLFLSRYFSYFAAIVTLTLVGALGVAAEGHPGIPAENTRVARKLVDALDSDSFLVRQKARDGLMRLGRAAIEPLEYGSKSESSEVRLRSTEMLIALRGRGLLGIGMLQAPFDNMPEWGAGVKAVPPGLPAEQAGIQTGDTILSLNGQPVADNNELQHLVFEAGPTKVMDVVVERGSEKEKLHVPILLTLNLNPPANPDIAPPVNLESELPESEIKGRAEARAEQIRANGFGAFVVVNGVVVQQNTTATPPNQALQPVDPRQLEVEFEAIKAAVQREEGDVERPAGK